MVLNLKNIYICTNSLLLCLAAFSKIGHSKRVNLLRMNFVIL